MRCAMQIGKLVQEGAITIKTGPFGTQLKASEYQESGTPVLNVKNLGYGSVSSAKLDHVGSNTVERLRIHLLKKGDIVFGRKGAVDRHAYIDDESDGWMQGSDCIRLRVETDDINPRFLSYYFLTNKHKAFMVSMCSHGTTMASLNQNILEQIDFPFMEREYQDKITGSLEIIDEKIKVNQKINENLLQQAQAIFTQEFLVFDKVPDSWQEGSLLDIADYLNGIAMQKFRPKEGEQGLPVLKIKELRQGSCDANSELCSPSIKPEYIVHDGDVIFSWSGSLHVDLWCGGTCGLNQHLFKVTSSKYDKWFYYAWTNHHLDKFAAIAAGMATTMGHIKREELAKAEVLIPSKADYDRIGGLLAPLYDLVIANRIENRKLAALRDELLPQLMSGQIDVSEVSLLTKRN